jgi:hypothetical protein
VLLSVLVHAFVASIVGPNFFTLAVLFILLPLAFVPSAVSVVVDTVAVGFVVFPLTVINITVSVDKTTSTVGFIVLPVTFIEGAIDPDLDALAILLAVCIPFTFVLCAVVESFLFLSGALDKVVVFRSGAVVESLEVLPDLHHEVARLLNFRVRLRESLLFPIHRAALELVNSLDVLASFPSAEERLHHNNGPD